MLFYSFVYSFVVVCPSLGSPSTDKKKKKKKKRGKKRRGGDSSEEDVPRPVVDIAGGEMPDGAIASDEEGRTKSRPQGGVSGGLGDALDQNLDM